MKLSNRIRLVRPLPTTAMHGRAEELKAQGQDVIDLSIAVSDFSPPQAVIDRTAEALHAARQPYTPVTGTKRLRSVLAKKTQSENRIDAQPDEVIVTNGVKQAVYEALYVLSDPGDEIIIFRPYWPAYLSISELLGLKPILVDLPEQITAETLAALPRAKIVVITSPHNPTGKVFSESELACLRDWIAANGSVAICDETYEKLVYEGAHVSLASMCDWRQLGLVTVFSASQSYAMMGWRVGFAVAPAPVVQAMEALQGPITAAMSALTQVAAEAAFSSGTPHAMVADYKARRHVVVERFADVPWMKMQVPASGGYLWGNISALTDDTFAFVEGLLEQEKIAVMPGDALGAPGWIRLSFNSESPETLLRAAEGIIRYGESLVCADGKVANG